LSSLVHPVLGSTELQRSTQILSNFHCYRGDVGLVFISSDFPIPHVYEDIWLISCRRGEVTFPRIRTYVLKKGYYEGSFDYPYTPSMLQCFVEIKDKGMKWDFICPRTWSKLREVGPDALSLLHRTDGYLGVTSSPGGPFVTFVPPTWEADEVSQSTGYSKLLRHSWGWLGSSSSLNEIPLVADLIKTETDSKLLQWFQGNGWKRCFSFEPDAHQVLVVGIVDWSRFFKVRVRNSRDFIKEIDRSFRLAPDGPYNMELDLSLYDRSGRPRRKKGSKKL